MILTKQIIDELLSSLGIKYTIVKHDAGITNIAIDVSQYAANLYIRYNLSRYFKSIDFYALRQHVNGDVCNILIYPRLSDIELIYGTRAFTRALGEQPTLMSFNNISELTAQLKRLLRFLDKTLLNSSALLEYAGNVKHLEPAKNTIRIQDYLHLFPMASHKYFMNLSKEDLAQISVPLVTYTEMHENRTVSHKLEFTFNVIGSGKPELSTLKAIIDLPDERLLYPLYIIVRKIAKYDDDTGTVCFYKTTHVELS